MPATCGRCRASAKKFDQKGTALPKDTHPTLPTDTELVLPEQVTIALGKLAAAAREGLLALAVGTGIQVLHALLAADVDQLVGPRGRHNPARTAVRHGTQPGQVTLGGRRVRVDRPRVRTADGAGEVPIPTWQAFTGTELLDQLALERMLAKLSTRRYTAGLEPVGASIEQTATGTSKSAVSRRFVAATEHALTELLGRDLSGLDLVALMVDGVHVAEHTCVVALGITGDGTKIPLGRHCCIWRSLPSAPSTSACERGRRRPKLDALSGSLSPLEGQRLHFAARRAPPSARCNSASTSRSTFPDCEIDNGEGQAAIGE
jgi:putative transposase